MSLRDRISDLEERFARPARLPEGASGAAPFDVRRFAELYGRIVFPARGIPPLTEEQLDGIVQREAERQAEVPR